MTYSQNPYLPRVRMDAVRLVRQGWSTRAVARHLGYTHSAIVKWTHRAPPDTTTLVIPTRSSRPHAHPRALAPELIYRILAYRDERDQCAEILHHRLGQEGYHVGLASIKRVLRRYERSRFSRWKKWHQYSPRPLPEKPGILVEIDTVWNGAPNERLYIYTLLDVCSRWAYARPVERINTHRSLRFVDGARRSAPFPFQTIQSDHGSEFSKWFTKMTAVRGISHRHSRIRQPNDNAHLERFNRTIQEECLARLPRTLSAWKKEVPDYLRWYNEKRPHMGLKMQSPMDIVKAVPSY